MIEIVFSFTDFFNKFGTPMLEKYESRVHKENLLYAKYVPHF